MFTVYEENDIHDIPIIDVYLNRIVDEWVDKLEDTTTQDKHCMKSLISGQSTVEIYQSLTSVH